MTWSIEFANTARKQLRKLGKLEQTRLLTFLRERIGSLDNPRTLGKALKGSSSDLWRYRVGDYRIICELRDATLVVLVVRVGHRKQIYRKNHGRR